MIRLSTDATGFTLDATDAEAIARHLAKWPQDEGHELTVERDGSSVQVRRLLGQSPLEAAREVKQIFDTAEAMFPLRRATDAQDRTGDSDDVLGDDTGSDVRVAHHATDSGEVTG